MDLEDTLSVKDACAYLHVSSKTIYRWIESGKLPAQKVGLQYFIKRDMVEAVASGRGVYIDNIVQRLETIEQRLDAIEKRLEAMTRPQPQEQPPAEVVAPVRAALASLKLNKPTPTRKHNQESGDIDTR